MRYFAAAIIAILPKPKSPVLHLERAKEVLPY
jgi:hypothetical protein